MDLHPLDGFAGGVALAHGFEARAILLHLGVAVHASTSSWYRGEGGFVDGGVAVVTVESQLAGMQFVAVGHGLDRLVSCIDYRRVSVIGEGGDGDYGSDARYGTCDF